MPAFVQQLDAAVETPKWGRIKADIAFGGVFYARIDVDQIGLGIVPEAARALAEAGTEIKSLLRDQIAVEHPEIPSLDEIAYVMFRAYQPDGSVVIGVVTALIGAPAFAFILVRARRFA